MAPAKLLPPDEKHGVYPPAAAEDRGIDGEDGMDIVADEGKSSSSTAESHSFSEFRDGRQFDDSDSYYESGEEHQHVYGTESDEAKSDGSESEQDGSESEPESGSSERLSVFLFPDDCSTNEEELEKFYDWVFNLEKTSGVFFNDLQLLDIDPYTYRYIKYRAKTAINDYNKKNQTDFRVGKIMNSISRPAGGAKRYMTFKAKDFNTCDVREFQAIVFDPADGSDTRVKFCRLKIPEEPCEGGGKCI